MYIYVFHSVRLVNINRGGPFCSDRRKKPNSSEVWQRLKTDERRMDKLDRSISIVEDRVKENLETVSEWFTDLTARHSPEIPREIVNSLQ